MGPLKHESYNSFIILSGVVADNYSQKQQSSHTSTQLISRIPLAQDRPLLSQQV